MQRFDFLRFETCELNICRMDLVPARVFERQMPHAFTLRYIHWYDHETKEVIFRTREGPWESSCADQWHLRQHGASWRLQKDSQHLVSMSSDTARQISSLFKFVGFGPHVHILCDKQLEKSLIELPRLKLDFELIRGDDRIRSRQYRGMILDKDQRMGTLVGLTSKLVLRHPQATNDRLILIPEGYVQVIRSLTQHVSVTIGRQDETAIHAYQLDTTLRRIIDNGALQSKLILAYLHALTSHCLPDLLTRHTGTEPHCAS